MTESALPYVEQSPMADVYADACVTACDYPVAPMPPQELLDRLTAEARWQEMCEEISTHGSLMRSFID